jgi:hypothetical protein
LRPRGNWRALAQCALIFCTFAADAALAVDLPTIPERAKTDVIILKNGDQVTGRDLGAGSGGKRRPTALPAISAAVVPTARVRGTQAARRPTRRASHANRIKRARGAWLPALPHLVPATESSVMLDEPPVSLLRGRGLFAAGKSAAVVNF